MATKKEKPAKPLTQTEKETAIDVGKTMFDKTIGKTIVNWNLVEPEVKSEAARLTQELQEQMASIGRSSLKMGETLAKLENLLKPQGIWLAYLNSFPGFNQATAYRFINGYRVAQKHYPPHVFDSVMASGMKMLGTEQKPFGVYTDVVKKLPAPRPTGNEEKDKSNAVQWLNKVESEYRKSRKRGAKQLDADELQREAFTAVLRRYGKVPNKQQLQWLRGLFAYILGSLQFKQQFDVDPKEPPVSFIRTQGASGDGKEDEAAA